MNRVAPAVGFGAVEMSGGLPPFAWYFDNEGGTLNDPDRVARRQTSMARGSRESYVSDDGYEVEIDVRWPASSGERHVGPVLLMLYGACGIDLDLDTDPDLRTWLDRGFAVAAPHVRGGGPERRHQAGTRAKRDRSLADAAAAIRHLRAGGSAVVEATELVVIGASAGGFLAATTVNTCADDVDVCIIVNGFVDPPHQPAPPGQPRPGRGRGPRHRGGRGCAGEPAAGPQVGAGVPVAGWLGGVVVRPERCPRLLGCGHVAGCTVRLGGRRPRPGPRPQPGAATGACLTFRQKGRLGLFIRHPPCKADDDPL